MLPNNKIKTLLDEIFTQSCEKSYRELFISLHPQLTNFANSILHSKEDAEEVVSDFFINLWAKKLQFPQIENPRLYIYVSIKNLSLNKLRVRKTTGILTNAEMEWDTRMSSIFFNPEELMMSQEVVDRLMKAINELPPRCRTVFYLVKENGMRYQEVATLLEISIKTVEAQMAIALKKIRNNTEFLNEFPELQPILIQKNL